MQLKPFILLLPSICMLGFFLYCLVKRYIFRKTMPYLDNPRRVYAPALLFAIGLYLAYFLFPNPLYIWPVRVLLLIPFLSLILTEVKLYAFSAFFLVLLIWSFL